MKKNKDVLRQYENKITEIADGIFSVDYPEKNIGRIISCELYKGVIIWINQFKTHTVPEIPNEGKYNQLKFNYAAKGICEAKISGDRYVYLDEGILSIDINEAQDHFIFPKGFYSGMEIVIDLDLIKTEPISLFEDCGVNFCKIAESLAEKNGTFLGRPGSRWKNDVQYIMEKMTEGGITREELRLRVLSLIYSYAAGEILPLENISYLTRGQKEIALEAAQLMRSHLNERLTIEQIAERYGISASALKKYFGNVFGMPISEYVRRERMKKAGELLRDTNKSVQEIAEAVGYQHQGKFGAVFKEAYGAAPLEYRRISRTEGGKNNEAIGNKVR